MTIRKPTWSKGLIGKAMAIPLSVALASGLAPSAAFAAEQASGGARLETASVQVAAASAMSSTSLYNEFLPVLFHAANGLEEFADDYQANGTARWSPEYFMFDIGNDGVPEMFVRTTSFAGNKVVHAFTIKSGKLVNLGTYLEGAYGTAGSDDGKLFVAGWDSKRSYVNSVSISGDKVVSKFVKSSTPTAAAPSRHVQMVTDYLAAQKASWVNAGSVNDYAELKNDGRYSLSKATVEVASGGAYTGKPKTPKVTVTFMGVVLTPNVDYKVSYKNNKSAGTASFTVTGVGNFKDSVDGSFTIAKAANTLTPVAAGKTFSFASVQGGPQAYKPVTFTKKGQGKVVYKNVSPAAVSKACSVNALTGAVTVKKGTPRGTYAMKMQVVAAGNANYKSATKTVAFKVVVK